MWSAEVVLVCALELLTKSAAAFPPIALTDVRPADVSPGAEAFVRQGERRIYLMTATPWFLHARRSPYRCGHIQALRKIASVLVHEYWHVTHGADEAAAYQAQLMTLAYLGAGPGNALYSEVFRSMRSVAGASARHVMHERQPPERDDVMSTTAAAAFAADWIAAWNAHDLDRILSHYVEDFEMISPVIVERVGERSGRLRGKDAVGAYWATGLRAQPPLRFELIDVFPGVRSIVLHYRSVGRRVVFEVLEFDDAGRVVRGRAHYGPPTD